MTKAKDLRDLSLDELEASYQDQLKLKFRYVNDQKQNKQFEKPHRIRQARKEIARLLTIIEEKKKLVA